MVPEAPILPPMSKDPDISVVVPLYNEEESLSELAAWVARVCRAEGLSYEVIFVDDGSRDGSWVVVERLATASPGVVRGIKFSRNYGNCTQVSRRRGARS